VIGFAEKVSNFILIIDCQKKFLLNFGCISNNPRKEKERKKRQNKRGNKIKMKKISTQMLSTYPIICSK